MKLDYNILWIDDKISRRPFQAILGNIKAYLSEEFFNFNSEQAEDFNEFKALYTADKEYDLIITDYSLNEGTTGKQVIDFIRHNKHNFTEIFFYSANKDIKNMDLFSKNRITFLQLAEGSYDELRDEIIEVISETIKKFQHIVAMRGMIMSETSSLDFQMLEILKMALSNEKINLEELATIIYDDLNNLYNQKNTFVNECRESKKFKKLSEDNFVFSAEYKIKTLGQILIYLEEVDFSDDYKKDINRIRNKFAHAILLKDEQGREYFKDGLSGLTFDKALCRKIRKDISEYKTKFESTLRKISN